MRPTGGGGGGKFEAVGERGRGKRKRAALSRVGKAEYSFLKQYFDQCGV